MIPDWGHHTPFILTSYCLEAVVLAALIAWLIWDGRSQAANLSALEHRRNSGD